jgi:plastocyanin
MYFSKTFISAALVGYAAATTHSGEASAASAASAAHTVSNIVASPAAAHTSAVKAAAPSAHTVAAAPAAHQTSAAGGVVVHVVQVGGSNATLRFIPDTVYALPGEVVQFQFNPKNHSIVQSTFDRPCTPIQQVMANKTDAINSGFMPSNGTIKPVYSVMVKDTNPIWAYCSQGNHCQMGMVMVINPPATGPRNLVAYAAGAKQATANISPGQSPGSAAPSAGAPVPSAPSGNNGAGASPPSGASNPSGTISGGAAQATTNAAPGLVDAARRSVFGLSLGGLVAFMLL